jgi:hypothetical protein
VTELRKALGDSARSGALVRTVPRFGYRFVGDVVEEPTAGAPAYAGVLVSDEREYLIPQGETLVGRGELCGVRLPSSAVSRVHARLRTHESRVSVEDAGSKNGTWINGTRRERAAELADGDEVSFGTFRVVFHPLGAGSSTRTGRPR